MTAAAKKSLLDLIQNSENAFLCSIDKNGFPVTRILANMRNKNMPEELKMNLGENSYFYFASFTNSDKVKEINANSNTSLYFFDDNMNSATITGETELVTNQTVKDSFWVDSLSHYYPLKSKDPSFAILKFTPKTYKMYDPQMQKFMGNIDENDEFFVFR